VYAAVAVKVHEPPLVGLRQIGEFLGGLSGKTVARYARLYGLPVYKPTGARFGSPIIAIPSELGQWQRQGARHG
jgi:hypothetical protein